MPQFRGRVRVDSQEIALYQVHFLPPHRLSHIREHRAQFADLLFKLEREVLPAVVVGDFNFSASSPQVADLRRLGFIDAHDQAGRGPGWTWPAPGYAAWMPRLRLDHLYIGEPLRAVECIGGPSVGSDHRPVVARIVYP